MHTCGCTSTGPFHCDNHEWHRHLHRVINLSLPPSLSLCF
uniref:Uncharacterized protein n=1 Tax=Arundo donax TaxID=35708 RepID=A0A0A9FTY8_ARUDO